MQVWNTVHPRHSVCNDTAIRLVPEDVARVFWHFLYRGQTMFNVSVV